MQEKYVKNTMDNIDNNFKLLLILNILDALLRTASISGKIQDKRDIFCI